MRRDISEFKKKRVVILGFGDSNTEFNDWSFGRNWFSMLACNGSDFFGRRIMINSGVSGNTVADGLKRIQEDVLDFHPDIVVVSFGLNDACQKVPLETFRLQYDELLIRLLEQNCCVVTRTSQPVIDMTTGGEELAPAPEIASYMKLITELSRKHQVPCVDHYTLWKESMRVKWHGELVMLMGNHFHPNEHGHRRLYHELAPVFHLEPDFQSEFTHLIRHQNDEENNTGSADPQPK